MKEQSFLQRQRRCDVDNGKGEKEEEKERVLRELNRCRDPVETHFSNLVAVVTLFLLSLVFARAPCPALSLPCCTVDGLLPFHPRGYSITSKASPTCQSGAN